MADAGVPEEIFGERGAETGVLQHVREKVFQIDDLHAVIP